MYPYIMYEGIFFIVVKYIVYIIHFIYFISNFRFI